MGTIKGKNGMGLTEAEGVKKRWQEYTEELYKRDLNESDNHDGVITHLEPDIWEWEVKWALGSITMNKASRSDRIPVELFQILKDDAVKVWHSTCQQIRKTQQWPQDWKRSVSIPIPKKEMAKNAQTATQLHLSHMRVKWCSKFSKPGFSNTWTVNFQMFKLVLEKAEEPGIKLLTSATSLKKQESSQKNIYFCFTDCAKAFDCVDHNKLWKILKEMGISDHLTCSWETCMQVRKQQLELDMEQQTGSK